MDSYGDPKKYVKEAKCQRGHAEGKGKFKLSISKGYQREGKLPGSQRHME